MHYKPAVKLKPTPELAYLIGVIQGDGTISKSLDKSGWFSSFSISIAIGHKDRAYVRILNDLIKSNLNYKPYIRNDVSCFRVNIYDRGLVRSFEGFKQSMQIPDFIKKNKRLLTAYLQGLFDTDGCCSIESKCNSGVIDFSSNKKELVLSIKERIENCFNINSNIRISRKMGYKPVYRLVITNKSNILKYINFIGFRHPRKEVMSQNLLKIYEDVRERSIRNRGYEKVICVLKNGELSTNCIASKLNLHRETVKEHIEKMKVKNLVKKRVFCFNRWGETKRGLKKYYWRLNNG